MGAPCSFYPDVSGNTDPETERIAGPVLLDDLELFESTINTQLGRIRAGLGNVAMGERAEVHAPTVRFDRTGPSDVKGSPPISGWPGPPDATYGTRSETRVSHHRRAARSTRSKYPTTTEPDMPSPAFDQCIGRKPENRADHQSTTSAPGL